MSELTKQIIHDISNAIARNGYTMEQSCKYVGVDYKEFSSWMDKGSSDTDSLCRELFIDVMSAAEKVLTKSQRDRVKKVHGDRRGYVYFLQDTALGKIKIGYARTNLDRRIRDLQAGCPQELRLVAFLHIEKAGKIEKELHKKYKNKHFRGEWFSLTERDIDLVIEYYDGVYVSG